MRPDPSHADYLKRWTALYEMTNYGAGLSGYFLDKSHEWLERGFSAEMKFSRVLEVGAGTGVHLRHVRHRFDSYVLSDSSIDMLRQAQIPKDRIGTVEICIADARNPGFADNSFDRLVVKPGGIISLVLPCDPGLGWRLGRQLVARRKFDQSGIEYDYWMAREHINPINNLVALLQYYFPVIKETWAPMRIPSIDLNLFYLANVEVRK